MPATQSIGPNGPEYYRQLLERPEEAEVLKMKRSAGTLVEIYYARMSWETYVVEHVTIVLERLGHLQSATSWVFLGYS